MEAEDSLSASAFTSAFVVQWRLRWILQRGQLSRIGLSSAWRPLGGLMLQNVVAAAALEAQAVSMQLCLVPACCLRILARAGRQALVRHCCKAHRQTWARGPSARRLHHLALLPWVSLDLAPPTVLPNWPWAALMLVLAMPWGAMVASPTAVHQRWPLPVAHHL